MTTIAAETIMVPTTSPSKIVAKPAPLGDATNAQKAPAMDAAMKEEALRIVRKHTKFDEEGNPCETVETEIEPSAAEEETPAEEEEVAGEEVAEEDAEEAEEDDDDVAAKMAYRSVPSFFNTDKERSATFEGKHTRFPEDDEGEEDAPAAPVCEEMQAKIDNLSASVSSAMVVEK